MWAFRIRGYVFLFHFLTKEDIFLDIGANVGTYTILASGEIGAKTVSVERHCLQHLAFSGECVAEPAWREGAIIKHWYR